jgi:hypothetical protein
VTGILDMANKTRLTIVAALTALASAGANAFTIQFDYSYDDNGFFAEESRKTLLQHAGDYFEARISDDLDAIAPGGINNFTAQVRRPDTGALIGIPNLFVEADTLVVFVGGRNLGGSLGVGGPAGYSAGGTSEFLETIRTRGEIGETTGPSATDFAPWGGSIAFNTESNWDFNADLSADAVISGNDFYSVALHELGHVLGFGTSDSWDYWISGGEFTGPASTASHGGNVPLEADGRHWESDLESTLMGLTRETAMDPTLTVGSRKLFTELDLAALEDIGWEVTPVPLPAAAFPFLAAVLATAAAARRGRRGETA